jgi:hypothetical protein
MKRSPSEEITPDMAAAKIGIIHEIHKQARKNFIRRKVYTKGIDDLWQADLVDMKSYGRTNSGMKYILTVIDVLSKFAWAVPVKSKSGKDVTAAFQVVLKESHPRVPKNLQTDDGGEFYNAPFQKLMQNKKINHYSTYTHLKASVVERFIRTIKNWMWKEFGIQGSYKWLSLLPILIRKYNSRVHRTIGKRPIDVKKANEKALLPKINTFKKEINKRINKRIKFKLRDVVRISKYKTIFEKGYTPSFSTELFRINRIRKTIPPVYYLQDMEGNIIKGGFYSYELQKTKYPDTYLVEKVLRRKGGRTYVKWYGFSNRHNSWI